MSFVFYDLETTGLNTRHDQILQFAAIVTDQDLVETGRIELRCRVDRHVVPHPEALLLTRRSLDDVRDPNLPSHYEMMCEIARLMERWSPTTIIGFNSIRFDEEMLRHALWRTLHNPYLTSWNGCVRADALTLARAVAFYSPEAMTIPLRSDGRSSFALQALCQSNGVQLDDAHGAMEDAEATLELCRRLMRRDEESWWRFLRFASKRAAAALVDSRQPFGAVRFRGNEPQPVAAAVVGTSDADANLRHCIDLACDLDEVAGMSDEALASLLASPERPTFRLRVNGCPTLCEIWDMPEAARGGLNDDECDGRAARIAEDPRLACRIGPMLDRLRPERVPSIHVEEQLYDSLPIQADDDLLRRFHQASWPERPALLARLQDPRVRRLGRRLIHLEAPDALPPTLRSRLNAEIERRLSAPAGSVPYLSVPSALEAVAAMGDRCPVNLAQAFASFN